MKRAFRFTPLLPLIALTFSTAAGRLVAQDARDSLLAGHRAYDRVDYAAAAPLLARGLDPGAGPRDSLWVTGVHKLTDALLETGRDSLARLYLLWAHRVAPRFPIDSLAFPPRVTGAIAAARAAILELPAEDSLAETTWEWTGDGASGRGLLRMERGSIGAYLAVLEGVGTVLPGESRTLPFGVYSVRVTPEAGLPLTLIREVLPGVITTVRPRARPVAAAAAAAAAGAAALPGALEAGGSATCSVTARGHIYCWGDNRAGRLGAGTTDSLRAPALVAFDRSFAAVSVGGSHACALTPAGAAFCWGEGQAGQLGNGSPAASPAPSAVSGDQRFQTVAAGASHTCALSPSGAAWCWGANDQGQLGNRGRAGGNVPVAVAAPRGVRFTALAAGGSHNCALTEQGAVWCWGANAQGQLGNGRTSPSNSPVSVSGMAMRALAAGLAHTCALTENGAAYCWGSNAQGQLGSSVAAASPRPVPVADSLVFQALVAGDNHTCGLTTSLAAYCWGEGRQGQLGNGRSAASARPVLVVGGRTFQALAAGSAHTCGRTAEAVVYCWGDGGAGALVGQRGRGSPTPTPVVVHSPSRPASAAAPVTSIRETFEDRDYTSSPAWQTDSAAPGATRIGVTGDGELHVVRSGSGGVLGASGLTLPVRVAVRAATAVQFDVMVGSSAVPEGCGLSCGAFPAMVRLRVRNTDQTESEAWYAYNDDGGRSAALGPVTIVARGDVPTVQWLRRQRFRIREALPRADTVLSVSVGGIGTDFEAWFDNLMLPAPLLASIAVTPDSAVLTRAGATLQLAASPRDSSGAPFDSVAISWSSSDTTVARVNPSGLVTAVGSGTARITAYSGAVRGAAAVTVRLPGRRGRPARRPQD